jgi:aminoglycoside/choline kinase family phosphotransferase
MSREQEIADFLARHGYGAARIEPLAQDASFRRYWRIHGGPRPAVLMDAPPPEDVSPFLRIGAHLARLGLSVPEILAADAATGLLLEEDLGDALLSAMAPREELFDAAVDVLATIQLAAPPANLPAWSAAEMSMTVRATLLDWWWPAAFGVPAPEAAQRDFADALAALLVPVAAGPVCFVHRDFFPGNLLWLPDRPGIGRLGVIDFQGAGIGHPAYDLVSLIQDARRDIPAALAERALARYLAARPELDGPGFHAAFIACAAQRHLRVSAQWVRLAQRDGRPGYLVHGPRTWQLLGQVLHHPAAAPLTAAMDRWIPPEYRANPRGIAA